MERKRYTRIHLVTAIILAAISSAVTSHLVSDRVSPSVIERAFSTPCEVEDSRNCYWDAGSSGNGEGQSFIDIEGVAYYVELER